jgi:hypothetical protein
MEEVVVVRIIDLLIDEVKEKHEIKLQLQQLVEREVRLMLSVLEHIESLEGPSKDMNSWAEEARDVVRGTEDMIDSFLITTAKTRSVLSFSDIFLGFRLRPKVKHLMRPINDLSKESKVFNIRTDGGGGG